jgi:vitamin B12 transporter
MAAAAPLAFAAAGPLAQEAAEPVELPEIVVGGGLTPVAAASYARAATIITAEDLERSGARTLGDALRQVPGVSVSRSGGPGGVTDIRIRGAESNHVLVVIDGVRTAVSSTPTDLSRISPEQIERIEVLRGPQAAIYGAGATAGVINIITKGGIRNGSQVTTTLEGTTAPGGRGDLLVQGGTDKADVGFGLSFRNDEGWDASGDGGEKDGLRQFSFNMRGSADLTEQLSIRANARFTDTDADFDRTSSVFSGDPPCFDADCYVIDTTVPKSEARDYLFGFAADLETFGGALVHTPSLSYAAESSDFTGETFESTVDEASLIAAYQAAYTFGAADGHRLAGAVQVERETYEASFAGGDSKTRDQIGYALDYHGQITDALFVQAGLRYDDNEDFDDFLSWSASASYSVHATGTRLRASIGRAQTNPTFTELFGFFPGSFVGNPDLKPERNLGWDIGVDQMFWGGRGTLSATYFNETLEDEIVGSGLSVANADGESDRQGVELGLSLAPVAGLTLSAAYTWLDAEDASTGRRELRRPEHSGSVGAVYRFLEERARVGVDLTYNGETDQVNFGAFPSQRVSVDDYLLVDVTAAYRLTETVELYGGVRNLFDADHSDVFGYAEEPVTGYLGLRATF